MSKKQKAKKQHNPIETMPDLTNCLAKLMEQVYNDPSMSAAQKLKSLNPATRTIIAVSAEQRAKQRELAHMGIKPNGQSNALTFQLDGAKPTKQPLE